MPYFFCVAVSVRHYGNVCMRAVIVLSYKKRRE